VLYVDNLFLTGVEELIARCKKDLASKFEMKDIRGAAAIGRDLSRTREIYS
jgi:hypothetical protein